LRAIAFEPAKRFPTAVAFAEALSAVLLATSSVRDEPPLREAVATSTLVAAPRREAQAAATDEPADRVGAALRWWTLAATTLTAMVFVVAFASLLRRAESRPALDLESDEAPVLAEVARRRPTAPVSAADDTIDAQAITADATAEETAETAPVQPVPAPVQPVPAEVPAPSPVPAEPPPAAEVKRPPPAGPVTPRPKKQAPAKDTEEPGELMPVRPTTVAAIRSLAERELQRSCGDPSSRRPVMVVVGIDVATGKLRRVEVRGDDVDGTLRACVAGRAGKAFQFAGLRERGSEYSFSMKL
jgi:hypothetical protein